ncbi:ABC transporter substrate-binding protein [Neobacillus cucumis]|uniref:ABC transporter substrate-binding protein n=1 Tax=Neobacillus cucumis TaxID=1740721 RepID=UPI001962C34E|nr:sugar ABC transporter substrate-binding protein [Neobacillus cucumis]MBM7654322.1 multiple sugar transport system substrate-binding protein [Neobacillus cucumis]
MKKHFALIFVLLLIIGSVMTGCSSKDTASTATDKDGKVTLKVTVWNYDTTPEFKALFDAYEKQNPNVKIEPVDIEAAQYDQKLTTMLAGNDDSDVLTMKNLIGYSNYAYRGQLKDLTSYANTLDADKYMGTLDYMKDDKGKIYALPYRNDFWVLYYNKKLFDKAGVKYPENLTWEEYRETAKKLTSGSGDSKVYGAYNHVWRSITNATAAAQEVGTPNAIIKGDYSFLSNMYKVFLGMQADKSVLDYGTAKSTNTTYASQFETEKAAMLPMGTWYMAGVLSSKNAGKTNVDWGIAPLPQTEKGKVKSWGSPTAFAVNKNAAHSKEAEKFVKWASGEEGAKVVAGVGVVPAYRTADINNIYFNVAGMPNDELSKKAFSPDSVNIEMPMDKNSAAIDKILGEEHDLIMIGENSIDKGIKEMDQRVKSEVLKK